MEASNALTVGGAQHFAPYGTAFDVSGSFDTPYGFTGEQTDAAERLLRTIKEEGGLIRIRCFPRRLSFSL